MDLWYRVELLVRSWLDRTAAPERADDAWQELDEFLRSHDLGSASPSATGAGTGSGVGRDQSIPADVRQALHDLELAPGASIEEIRAAYRRQLRLYHPDRHAADRDRYEAASEVTRRLTLAYRRLCDYYR